MTVYFNTARKSWTYDFWYMGTRYQGYCVDPTGFPVTSKKAAQQAEQNIRRLATFSTKHARAHEITLAQVVTDLRPRWQASASWDDKKRHVREILDYFRPETAVREISGAHIREYAEFALARPRRIWKGGPGRDRDNDNHAKYWKRLRRTRSPATVNRYLSVLRQIMKHAAEMRDPITRQPVLEAIPAVRDMTERKRRARPIPEQVLQRLLELLPEHAQDAVVLTLFFGFRLGEAFSLQQKNVDWHAEGIRLFAEDVKDNEDAFLPAPQEAMGYLRCLSIEAEKRGVRYLLTYRQSDKETWRPMANVRSAWDRAMDIVEKETGSRWRWHDLRAAYITHVALTSGAVTAQTMARHSNFDTTKAYIDVADESMRIAAERTAQRPALQMVRGSP